MSFTTSHRLNDERGCVPSQNFGVNIAKNLTFANTKPYILAGDIHCEYTVDFSFHFIKNLRRILSGVTGDHRFTVQEEKLYQNYLSWLMPATILMNIPQKKLKDKITIYSGGDIKVYPSDVVFDYEVIFIGHFLFKGTATFRCGYKVLGGSTVTFKKDGLVTPFCDGGDILLPPKVFYDKITFTEEVHFIGHFIFKQDIIFNCGYIVYPDSTVMFEGIGLVESGCEIRFTDEDIAVMCALDQRLVHEVMCVRDHNMLRTYTRENKFIPYKIPLSRVSLNAECSTCSNKVSVGNFF